MATISRVRLPLFLAAVAASLFSGLRAEAAPAPLQVLLLTGQNNHAWQQTTPALKRVYEESGRFTVEVTDKPSALNAAMLASYDVVVSNWTNFPSPDRTWGPEAERALLDLVRAGKGFVVFHAASACFPTWPEYQQLIGATWGSTTGHGAIHRFSVTIADKNHPITRGMSGFMTTDELWHRIALQPTAKVLCTAFSAADTGGTGKDEPVALATELGRGRGFNLVLGHDVAGMETPGWRLLMLRGTEWAATGEATLTVPVDVDVALNAASGYQRYQDRTALAGVELLVQYAAGEPALRERLAAKMVERLRSTATSDGKAFLLQQLSLIGSAREVPAIAALLGDKDLGFYALGALERIPGDEAAAALRRAAAGLDGPGLIGCLNALAEKRDSKAVELIARALSSKDEGVVAAAVEALGRMGGAPATDALQRFAASAPAAQRGRVAEALLECADGLRAAGQAERARPIYQNLAAAERPKAIRYAALVGLVASSRTERGSLVLDALAGEDPIRRAAALHCLRDLGDRELAKSVAAKLASFRPTVQAQVLDAFGEIGATEVAPAVAGAVSSADPQVRAAAIVALGRLGGAAAYPTLLKALRAAPSDAERPAIETALARVCRRAEGAGGALPLKLSEALAESPANQASLFRALALVGDATALELLRGALRQAAPDTRLAALQALALWPDGAPLPDLLSLARSTDRAGEGALALRSIAALSPRSREQPGAAALRLGQALPLARTVETKRALLDALGRLHDATALDLAAAVIADPSVTAEACAATVTIAEGLPESQKPDIQTALTKVLAAPDADQAKTRAKQLLMRLGIPVDVTRSAALTNTGPNLALGATATSPDGLDSDGAASGDQAAIDGDPSTYWDEVDLQKLYVLRVTFKAPQTVSALRITGYQQHAYAPKDFEVLCDDKVVKTIKDAWYEANQFAVTFPPTTCTSLELRVTGYYGQSPAIRELEIFNPGGAGQ